MEKTNKNDFNEKENEIKKGIIELNSKDVEKTIKDGTEVIDSLPNDKRNKIKKMVAVYESFSGPIPHPTILNMYNKIEKGFADRIISMAEKEQNSAIEHERKLLEYQSRDSLLGAIFAFVTIVLLVLLGFILILNDKNLAGYAALVVGFGSCASIFFKRTPKDK